jgi:hypothetical protein
MRSKPYQLGVNAEKLAEAQAFESCHRSTLQGIRSQINGLGSGLGGLSSQTKTIWLN